MIELEGKDGPGQSDPESKPASPENEQKNDALDIQAEFWSLAQKFGMNKEEFEKEQEKASTRCKLCWDISLPIVLMILIWVASSQMVDSLPYPGVCKKTQAQDYSCYKLDTFSPPAKWLSSKGTTIIDPTVNTSMLDPNGTAISNVLESAMVLPAEATRVCKLLVETATPRTDGRSVFYRTTPAGWKTVLSLYPFIVIFQGILGLQLSSKLVAPFAMFVTILLGLNFFRDGYYFNGDDVTEVLGKVGMIVLDRFWWTLVEYAISVFSAFFFLRVLQLWGAVDLMRKDFEAIAPNANRKVMIVAFCFAVFLAVVAPGGSNFVIAGSILIAMNLANTAPNTPERLNANLNIGAIALFGNAVTSAFNLLGICITTLSEDIAELDPAGLSAEDGALKIGQFFSLQYLWFATLSPVLMVFLFRPEPTIIGKIRAIGIRDFVVCAVVGALYGILQYVISGFVGPELPCLIAGGIPLILYILFEKRNELRCALPAWQDIKKRHYVIPFIVLIAVLLIYGIPEVEKALTGKGSKNLDYLSPLVFSIATNEVSFARRFDYIYNSGCVIFVIAVLTPFMIPYTATGNEEAMVTQATPGNALGNAFVTANTTSRDKFRKNAKLATLQARAATAFVPVNVRRKKVLKEAFKEAAEDVIPVLLSITSFASIARLMGYFEMTQAIAKAIVGVFGNAPNAFAFFMPVIGMLGSGLTGSTTTSNFLFARLQITTCTKLGLLTGRNSIWEVAALQVLGASAGEIISPMNAVVITLMDGITGGEAPLIKRVLVIFAVWLLSTMIVGVSFLSS